MLNPQVSIIVPLYNKVNEVQRAIDSIFAQTIQDFELIIVDGGSTDGSMEKIKPYLRDPRIIVYHQRSTGVSGARNEGIELTSANLVTFLDADDEWKPTYLEEILFLQKMYPQAGIYATAYMPTFKNEFQKLDLGDIPDSWKGILPSYFHTVVFTKMTPFFTSSAAVPRNILFEMGLFRLNERMGEDTDLWARIALHYDIAYSSTSLVKYHQIAGEKATQKYIPLLHHPFYRYIDNLPEEEKEEILSRTDVARYLEYEELNMAWINIIAGNKANVRKNIANIYSKEYRMRKLLYQILLYSPSYINKYLPIIKQKTLDKLRCLSSEKI